MNFEALLDEFATPDNKVALEEVVQNLMYLYSLKRSMRKSVAAIEKFRRGEPLTKKDVAAFTNVLTTLPYLATLGFRRATTGYYKFYEALDNIKATNEAQARADKATADVMKEESPLFSSFAGTPDEPMLFDSLDDLSAWIKDATKRSK